MNVIGYIRVSTQGQVKEGYSLKYQEDEIKAYCKEHRLKLIHIFRDEDPWCQIKPGSIRDRQGGLTGDVGSPFFYPN